MARDWRSVSIAETHFQKYYFVHVSGTKNDGEFESDIKKLKKWVFSVGWGAKSHNEQQIFRFYRFSRCENQSSPWKLQGSLQTNRMGIPASMNIMRFDAREKETKNFPVFSTGKLLWPTDMRSARSSRVRNPPGALFFSFIFFGFSSFFHCVGAFLGFFLHVYRTKRVPCLPWKFDTAESPCQAVSRFFSNMNFLRGGWPVFSVFLQSPQFFTRGKIFERFLEKSGAK